MKILLLSDTRERLDKLKGILKKHAKCDYVFHLGDGYQNLPNPIANNVFCVQGNRDILSDCLPYKVVTLQSKRFLLTHGHEYGVKMGLARLMKLAKQEEANVVCFGHSNRFYDETIDGIRYINPGFLDKRSGLSSSYAVMDFTDGKIKVKKYDI